MYLPPEFKDKFLDFIKFTYRSELIIRDEQQRKFSGEYARFMIAGSLISLQVYENVLDVVCSNKPLLKQLDEDWCLYLTNEIEKEDTVESADGKE